jgi:hypothetical protein
MLQAYKIRQILPSVLAAKTRGRPSRPEGKNRANSVITVALALWNKILGVINIISYFLRFECGRIWEFNNLGERAAAITEFG